MYYDAYGGRVKGSSRRRSLLISVGFPLFASPNIMSNGHSGHRLRLQANPRHASFL